MIQSKFGRRRFFSPLHVWRLLTVLLFPITQSLVQSSLLAANSSPRCFRLKWGTYGPGDGQVTNPWGLAADAFGNVYVADRDNHQIKKFTRSGTFIKNWGTFGSDHTSRGLK